MVVVAEHLVRIIYLSAAPVGGLCKKSNTNHKLLFRSRVDVDSSDESDIDDDLDQPAVVKTKHHDLMMKSEGSRKGSFFKQAKKAYPMFPMHEERIKWDEYGEIIRCCPAATSQTSQTDRGTPPNCVSCCFLSQARRVSGSRVASYRGGEKQAGVRLDQWGRADGPGSVGRSHQVHPQHRKP